MTREEHLQWCKERALEYVDAGELQNALASIGSDLTKHAETRDHPGAALGVELFMQGHLSTPEKMRRFIEGFR